MKKLGDAELEIMMVLWETQEPVTSTYILEHIRDKRKWGLSTLMTILARMAEKDFIICDRSTRTNLYTAKVGEAEYKAFESTQIMTRLFGNSVQDLVAALYNSHAISREDVKALRTFIDEMDRKEGKDDQ